MARPPPSNSQPPVSFKTVPGRNRTQKWNTARTYDYSGGDWGGYDPYDDYGDDYNEQPPMPTQNQPPPPSQQYQGYPRPNRQQSFDTGDERRAFSGPGQYPPRGPPGTSPAQSNMSGGSNDYPRPSTAGRRDFTNPEQVPPPLYASSPPPVASAQQYVPPPRKSSISGSTPSPVPPPEPQISSKKEGEKDLPTIPFIRPSDIYKRMEAEKEKERKSSMESSGRPSLADLDASTRSSSQQRPLSSVQEGDGEGMLPAVQGVGGFGDGMWNSQATTRAPAGADPAADILAERTHDVPVSQIGQSSTPRSADPAASILAERTHNVPVSEIGRQESKGYRSMVNQAFDSSTASRSQNSVPATPASRDGPPSLSTTDVSRSNTTSTSSISPIMSQVPAASRFDQQPQGKGIGTIAEEPTGRVSSDSHRIQRKPSPSALSRDAIVQPGYRRSLDPPSNDNSPARTPGVDDATRGRSLSQGLAAETISDLPESGRSRSGTDYSVRESDLAREVNSSPEKGGFESVTANREREVQDEYLKSHPSSPGPNTAISGEVPSSGRSSPTKSRVRQLADQYQDIHDSSRRNSQVSNKSSWSNFRGSDENLPASVNAADIPQRHATDASNVYSESNYGGVEEGGIRDSPVDPDAGPYGRPELGDRDPSFRPQMPGEWVSTSNVLSQAATPGNGAVDGSGRPSWQQHTPRASQQVPEDETVDLTPTTKKVPLDGSYTEQRQTEQTMLGQAKNAGNALGAALLSSVGQGHQTRDFGSSQPAAEVEVPSERSPTGELGGLAAPHRPWLGRNETDTSLASTVTAASHDSGATPTQQKDDAFYGMEPVAPLRTRGTSPEAPASSSLAAVYSRPSQDLHRDDSTLRREIVRSLDGGSEDRALTQDAIDAPDNMSKVEHGERAGPANEIDDDSPSKPRPLMLDQRFSWEARPETKGALDTPEKDKPLPVLVPRVQEPDSSPEIKPEMPYERPRSRGLHIMNADNSDSEDENIAQERDKTQLRDSMAAERGLEIGLPVGAAGLGAAALGAGVIASQSDRSAPEENPSVTTGVVSPMTKSQEELKVGSLGDLSVPSPPATDDKESPRLPSYYMHDSAGIELAPPEPIADGLHLPETDSAPEPVPTTSDAPLPPEKDSSTSPTSPTSKQKIPPFREILALKTPSSRIASYDSTRQTFADMNTGLSDWLAGMVESNPEYANLSAPGAGLQTSGTWKPGHKASPSLAKFTPKGLGFGTGSGGSEPQRSNTVSAGGSGTTGGDLQQKGKELMSSGLKGAGVLGGKAQAGAKGLLAKGRSRFGTQRESKGKV
jgi:hypothetical protein